MRVICKGAILLGLCISANVATAQLRGPAPRLIEVHPRVTTASGYALGHAHFVATDDCVVVIDTTESPRAAADILAAYRAVSELPIKYVIYTHFHGDHVNGARMFAGDRPQIIAQRLHTRQIATFRQLWGYNRRLNAIQFGSSLEDPEPGIALSVDPRRPRIGYVVPNVLFDDVYRFEAGGVNFQLEHAPGETPDQLFVWLPDERIAFCGDLFYPSFPMLASPMKPDRPVLAWAESLDRIRALRPRLLVGSHGAAVHGEDAVDRTLAHYAEAIRAVHDQTIEGINRGATLAELRETVRLPDSLANLPYLAELYGRVSWGVEGVYRQYTGWYDRRPSRLNPGRPEVFAAALVRASGGAGAIVGEARRALSQGDAQLALELCDTVLVGSAETKLVAEVHQLCATALDELVQRSTSLVERNIYRVAAQEHRALADQMAADELVGP